MAFKAIIGFRADRARAMVLKRLSLPNTGNDKETACEDMTFWDFWGSSLALA